MLIRPGCRKSIFRYRPDGSVLVSRWAYFGEHLDWIPHDDAAHDVCSAVPNLNLCRWLRNVSSVLFPKMSSGEKTQSSTAIMPESTRGTSDKRLLSERFPRSSKYHPEWVLANASGGANSLWLTEWLTSVLELRPSMRVLDLGCGRASSSIFLRREFGVQVWATDLWFSATENLQRIRDAEAADGVFPIHADARSMPFAAGFFDAIIAIDSFMYFGTDDLYLNGLAPFLKPGGTVAIAVAGLMREIESSVPHHLRDWWTQDHWCLHSSDWWRRHWERTGIVEIEQADTMPDGWQFWLDWQRAFVPDNAVEIEALEADRGTYLGYVRVVGRIRTGIKLSEPIVSIPIQYNKKPLLRGSE